MSFSLTLALSLAASFPPAPSGQQQPPVTIAPQVVTVEPQVTRERRWGMFFEFPRLPRLRIIRRDVDVVSPLPQTRKVETVYVQQRYVTSPQVVTAPHVSIPLPPLPSKQSAASDPSEMERVLTILERLEGRIDRLERTVPRDDAAPPPPTEVEDID